MIFDTDARLLLLGLQGSGKTHFLVALDWILDCQTEADGLSHLRLADDRSYLQPLREKWLRGEDFGRTSRTMPPPPHQLLLEHKASGRRISFHLPDLAGESFESHFVTRTLPLDFANRFEEASGLFLFVHADQNADHELLEEPVFFDNAPEKAESDEENKPSSGWQPELAARQCKLVDLLQFIAQIRKVNSALPVAVMVSAWDLIARCPKARRKDIPTEPNAFFETRWPLLSKYLQMNHEVFKTKVFGVSARGGGTASVEVERLINMEPSERVCLVDENGSSTDLSRPVRWLLGLLAS